ncbi:putative conjugative transfer protein TraD [Legionella busanensis]|uniref:Putative conjugative transfer protein TraD n=1 Tax=Legionella busanensis TaxID=190655 RepID=A0A378KAB6_9GAMM|nr:type IV conjugative transfer system coupling protein TraD [Legionella busanensis]STX81270.1 putative conjugative transfer protein TraD [Legionella busanensis]
MKTSGLHFIRGGQVFDFSMRMMFQVLNRILAWAILGYFLLVIALLYLSSMNEIYLIAIKLISNILTHMGKGNIVVWHSDNAMLTAYQVVNSKPIASAIIVAKQVLWSHLIKVLYYSGIVYLFIVWAFYYLFKKQGEKLSQDKYLSGTRLAKNTKETIKSLKKSGKELSDIKLLNLLPMPKHSEKQGILFHGSTGSGKTQALMHLLEEIRASGDPAIIYDKECTIKPYFFNSEKDIELNPVSVLCANWDMWEECANPLELGTLATYLIPKSVQGSDPFWVDAARTILTSMAWRIKDWPDKSAIVLLQLLLTTTLDEMRGILKGTESENLVSKEIEKTAISIKSVMATYTKALRFLEGLNTKDKKKFSIKNWVADTCREDYNNGWLFITSRSQYHKEIKPIVSLWLGLAMQAVQSLEANHNRRIWLIMDELASLHRLEMLSDTMADIRKFGGCVAIGIQSIAQLDFLYGTHEASAIADLLNTSIYFRSPKAKVAKWVSDDLGEQVITEIKESRSYGPDSVRDGNTVGTQRTTRKTIEPSQIMTLENLECYVRLVGNHPITFVKNNYVERETICKPLIERQINFDALDSINQAIIQIQSDRNIDESVRKINLFEKEALSLAEREPGLQSSAENETENIESSESPIVIKEIYN